MFRSLIALWFLITTAGAQQLLVKEIYSAEPKIEASVTSLIAELPLSGYASLRVKIINEGKAPQSFSLDFRSHQGYGSEYGIIESSFSVSCAPESQATHDIYVPLDFIPTSYSRGTTSLSGDLVNSDFGTSSPINVSSSKKSDLPFIALSSLLSANNASALDAAVNRSSRRSESFSGSFDPQAFPSNPKGLVGYQVIIATPDDIRSFKPGAAVALRQWITSGGTLILVRETRGDTLATLDLTSDNEPFPGHHHKGKGKILFHQVSDITKLSPVPLIQLVKDHTDETISSKLSTDYSSGWGLSRAFGTYSFNPLLIILVLLGFAILVGPINLFVFAKAGKRHRLFITTPLISLGTSLLLVLLIILQDGFGGNGVRVQHIELGSSNEPYAAVSQEQIARTGILLGNKFTLPDAVNITPVALPSGDWARSNFLNTRFTVAPAESGFAYAGDYFQSRSEQAHLLRAVRPSRERLTLISGGAQPVVSSSFPYELETVFYRDSQDTVYYGTGLAPGQRLTLTIATPEQILKASTDALKLFSFGTRNSAERCFLRPNSMLAITEAAPGIDSLKSVKWTSTQTVITGLLQ